MTFSDNACIEAFKYYKGEIKSLMVHISAEYSVTICINNAPMYIIKSSGSNWEDLVIGHLVSEGIIRSIDDVHDITIDEDKHIINVTTHKNEDVIKRVNKLVSVTSGIIKDATFIRENAARANSSLPEINAEGIIQSMSEFLRTSKQHELTHGVHSSALYHTDGKRIVFFDEIGRHNVIDKVVGYAFKNRVSLEDKMILSTGRMSSEIIYKILSASAPVILSRASPSDLAVELARKYNIIMIGKIREDSFYIFNGKDKII